VEAPGLGDEVQAIKAGILEIADVLVVNKADRPGVDRTTRALSLMLELETDVPRSVGHHGMWIRLPLAIPEGANAWPVTIHQTIAVDGEGVERLYERIEAHRQWLTDSGELATRERLRIAHALEALTRAELRRRLANTMPQAGLDALIESIRRRELNLYDAIAHLLSGDKE
jgi:LAO/AO transport system kinase